MKEFIYEIKDPQGIHARPAGLLVKKAGLFKSNITISKDQKSADLKKIFGIMGLGARHGEKITITVSGEDEEAAFTVIEEFIKENL